MLLKTSPDPKQSSCGARRVLARRGAADITSAHPAVDVDDGTDDDYCPWLGLTLPDGYALVLNYAPEGFEANDWNARRLLALRWEDYTHEAVISWFHDVAATSGGRA